MNNLNTFQALDANNNVLLTTLSRCAKDALRDIYSGFFRKKLHPDLNVWKKGGKRILDKKAGIIYHGDSPRRES